MAANTLAKFWAEQSTLESLIDKKKKKTKDDPEEYHLRVMLHRLMWVTYVGDIPEGNQIDHLSGNKHDNRLVNLDCVTAQENSLRAASPEHRARAAAILVARCRALGLPVEP